MWGDCKQVNKDTQTPGGIKGLSLKPKAVSKFYFSCWVQKYLWELWRTCLTWANQALGTFDLQEIWGRYTVIAISTLEGWWSPFHARSAFQSTGSITLVFSCYWWLLEEHIENVLGERVCSARICVDCRTVERDVRTRGKLLPRLITRAIMMNRQLC